jgi:hypothetical protein
MVWKKNSTENRNRNRNRNMNMTVNDVIKSRYFRGKLVFQVR